MSTNFLSILRAKRHGPFYLSELICSQKAWGNMARACLLFNRHELRTALKKKVQSCSRKFKFHLALPRSLSHGRMAVIRELTTKGKEVELLTVEKLSQGI